MPFKNHRPLPGAILLPLVSLLLLLCPARAAGAEMPGAAGPMPAPAATVEPEQIEIDMAGKVVALPIRGAIVGQPFSDMPDVVMRHLEQADREGAHLVVLEIDSPGGEVGICDTLAKKIFETKTPVVALVLHKAVSGGAMVASAAREIVMTRTARIGDIQPMQAALTGSAPEMDERTAEKIEVDIRTIMKVYAQARGRPERVVEAMVSRAGELYRVEFEGGAPEFLTGDELKVLEENIESGRDKRTIAGTKIIKPEGKLLELSAQEAVEWGLASEIVEGAAAFYAARGISEEEIVRPEIAEGELDLAKLLPSMDDLGLPVWVVALLGVFLVAGIAGFVTEYHAPGSGLPAAIGIIGFVCFFATLLMYDRGSPIGIAIFLIGVGLLVVEIMVLPGFGIPGVAGILAVLGGLLLAFTPDWGSEYMQRFMWHEVGAFTILVCLGLAAAVATIWFISEHGMRLPVIGRFFMTAEQKAWGTAEPASQAAASAESQRFIALMGKTGAAATTLRPAGKARLDTGELLDVVSDGSFVPEGARVRVIEAGSARVVVAPAESQS